MIPFKSDKTSNSPSQLSFLVSDKTTFIAQWAMKLQAYINNVDGQLRQIDFSIKHSKMNPQTAQRLEMLKAGHLRQKNQIIQLLKELGIEPHLTGPLKSVMQNRIPSSQHIQSYFSNIFRDWAWNNGENDAAIKTLKQLTDKIKFENVLFIGAGAGRLPHDFSLLYPNVQVYALDINPLLLSIGQKVSDGIELALTEIPQNPLHLEFVEKNWTLTGGRRPPNLHFILADFFNAPIELESFDLIITHWFIDIVPETFINTSKKINSLLKLNAHWINFGPTGFNSVTKAKSVTSDEIKSDLKDSGFLIINEGHETVDYLASPLNSGKRTEQLFKYSVKKVTAVEPPLAFQYYPSWLINLAEAIPVQAEWQQASQFDILASQIILLADGTKSIDQISNIVSSQLGIPKNEAEAITLTVFSRKFES